MSRLISIDGKFYPPSTIQSWKDSGIPQKHQQWILDRGRALKVKIGPSDFFDRPATEAPPKKRAGDRR